MFQVCNINICRHTITTGNWLKIMLKIFSPVPCFHINMLKHFFTAFILSDKQKSGNCFSISANNSRSKLPVSGRIWTSDPSLRRIEHAFLSPLICVNPSQAKSRIKSTFESISVNLNIISVSLRQPVNISKMFATANNRVEGHCQWPGIRSAIMPEIREW